MACRLVGLQQACLRTGLLVACMHDSLAKPLISVPCNVHVCHAACTLSDVQFRIFVSFRFARAPQRSVARAYY